MEKLLPFIAGIVSGGLAAFYGPYLAESIKTFREKRSLRLAIYRELVYMYRLVSDLFEHYYPKQLDLNKKESDDKQRFLDNVSFFISYYKTFLYERDLYKFIREDFARLKLFYQLDEAFVIEKTYIDFYRTFTPEVCQQSPEVQYQMLNFYRKRFENNARDGVLSEDLLKKANATLHYGRESIEQDI